ncbi:rhodanese-like domain-containing protein [Rheinheimera sp.]|uniref:rhodanese-like domain-containing protein n=1 Tax=Rheinheimera sp. TaxID=1869214 RepID=UPI002FDD3817
MQKLLMQTSGLAVVLPALLFSTSLLAAQFEQTGVLAGTQAQALQQQTATEKAGSAIWIDVRTADEFNAGHLVGALHIPHEQIAAQIAKVTQDKNAEIYLYCRSGRRSGLALDALQAQGYTRVVNAGAYEKLKEQAAEQKQQP